MPLKGEFGKKSSIVSHNLYSFNVFRCFPHIVNLACKAVLGAITNLKYIDDMVQGYEDFEPGDFIEDPVAKVRSLVNAVSLNF